MRGEAKNREPTLAARIRGGIGSLFPGYFAVVMATGIISLAAHSLGMRWAATILLWANIFFFVLLTVLYLARFIFFLPKVLEDLHEPLRGPGFFTLVAGVCVFGSQLLLVAEKPGIARTLWFIGIGLWAIVMYSFFTSIIIREKKPPLERGISGGWLLAVVATQSVSELGTLLAKGFSTGREVTLFFALVMYLLGAMLYLNIITVIFYRFILMPMTTRRLSPTYWINMGAVAITTLVGSTLLLHSDAWDFLHTLRPFLEGFTLFFWAAGTWWIPLLIILGVWRHGVRGFPLSYDPHFWAGVFPIGMYTVATYRLSISTPLGFLEVIPRFSIYVAYFVWIVSFAGLIQAAWAVLFGSGREAG